MHKAKKTDKLAYTLLFGDGATTPFYLDKHPKATASKTHIYLLNPDVKVTKLSLVS